jgi:sulfite reductase (NADPH) hemoprotein beta-component
VICCPGLDYCDLANARSIPQALEISKRFEDLDYQHDIGELNIKMSGCINACGHHHVGHIGILGINKRGEEAYQLSLGGAPGNDASLGKIVGPALAPERLVDAVEKVVTKYLELRSGTEERFPGLLSARRHGALQGGRICRSLKTSSSSPATATCWSQTMPSCRPRAT